MNDLKEIWEGEKSGSDMLEQMLQNKSFMQAGYQTPLAKLKRNLAIHLAYGIVITLGYAFLIYFYPLWQVQACMLLLIVFNLWAMKKAFDLYYSIDLTLTETNVLAELKKRHHAFSEWQKQSLRASLFIYPFAAAGGFMLGGAIGSGKPVEEFMTGRILVALVIALIVLVPLSYLLAKWMTRISFGKYVDQLKHRIDELEDEN